MNLYNIPASANFLQILASEVMRRFISPEDALSCTIYLPSRRTARALREAFLSINYTTVFLPEIKPFEDIDELDLLTVGHVAKDFQLIPSPISILQKRMILIDIIVESFDKSAVEAKNLADEFITLLEVAQKYKKDFAKIFEELDLSSLQHATQELFLKLYRQYQTKVISINRTDKQDYLNKVEQKYQLFLQENLERQIIVAGIYGSSQAELEFLDTVHKMPNSMLVFYGLDQEMQDEEFDAISNNHPQIYYKNLLAFLGVTRNVITTLGDSSVRDKFLSASLLPPHYYSRIRDKKEAYQGEVDLSLICSENIEKEASVIALIVRNHLLEFPENSIQIVSYNNWLIPWLNVYLARYNIAPDNSLGTNFGESDVGGLFLRIVRLIISKFDIISGLSLLKHPFVTLGREVNLRGIIRSIEIEILRDQNRNFPSLIDLIKELKVRNIAEHQPLIDLEDIIKDAKNLLTKKRCPLKEALEFCLKFAEKMVGNNFEKKLFYGDSGDQFYKLWQDFLHESIHVNNMSFLENLALIQDVILKALYRKPYGNLHNVYILSPHEARFLHTDLTIISGTNAQFLPENKASFSYFIDKILRKNGINYAELKQAESYFNFYLLAAKPSVVITYSEKVVRQKAEKANILYRITSLFRLLGRADIKAKYLLANQQVNMMFKQGNLQPYSRPNPSPVKDFRPKSYSATDLEKMLYDPYYIYAKHILKLKELPEIRKSLGPREFGIFLHLALEIFAKNTRSTSVNNLLESLLEAGSEAIAKLNFGQKELIELLWMPRFKKIAKNFMDKYSEFFENKDTQIFAEIWGSTSLELERENITIKAKIDRLDFNKLATITDYKTGVLPSKKSLLNGKKIQLGIEGLVAADILSDKKLEVAKLELVRLTSEAIKVLSLKGEEAAQAIENAREQITNLLKESLVDEKPYMAGISDESPNEYEHFERKKEWINISIWE